MNLEHKSIHTEIKAASDGGFEGYAAFFGNKDSYGDIITTGAFAKTLAERAGKVRVLWNHDSAGLPIGTPQSMSEDNNGLYVKAQFSKTTLAQDVRTLIQEGAIDSMSIGYSTIKADYAEDGGDLIRYLKELKLYEFSPVLFPANESAIITGAKSIGHIERIVSQLDNAVSVGIKSGHPLSADNLTKLKAAYAVLGQLLQEKAETETEEEQPVDDLAGELKSFREGLSIKGEIHSVEDEIRSVLRSIRNLEC